MQRRIAVLPADLLDAARPEHRPVLRQMIDPYDERFAPARPGALWATDIGLR